MCDKIIICFLTFRPKQLFYELCKEILEDCDQTHQGYICIDDNSYEIPNYDGKIPIIQIDNTECETNGFKNTVTYCKDQACSRDKALYYFCKLETDYRYIWFIEEDVFIPSKMTIPYLDDKYSVGDLITSAHDIIETTDHSWYYAKRAFEEFSEYYAPPYAKSLVCAIRVSRKMMEYIEEYADFYNTLHFCEILFNTLAMKNDLEIIIPEELSTILFQNVWKTNYIDRTYLYHPIKDMFIQSEYRKQIRNIPKK